MRLFKGRIYESAIVIRVDVFCLGAFANHILIPMDASQSNHLKAYGVAYHALKKGYEIQLAAELPGR